METRITYSYWTGTQWVPQEIVIRPVMATGWHIFNVVMSLLTFGIWLPVYLIAYLSAKADRNAEIAEAQESIQAYMRQVGVNA